MVRQSSPKKVWGFAEAQLYRPDALVVTQLTAPKHNNNNDNNNKYDKHK